MTDNGPLLRPSNPSAALPTRRPQAIPAVRDIRRQLRPTAQQQQESLLSSPAMLSLRTSLRMIVLEIFMEAGDAKLQDFVESGAPGLSPENRWFVVNLLIHENTYVSTSLRAATTKLHSKLNPAGHEAECVHRKMREELRSALGLAPELPEATSQRR